MAEGKGAWPLWVWRVSCLASAFWMAASACALSVYVVTVNTFADMPTDPEGHFDIDGVVRDVPWDLTAWLSFGGVIAMILVIGFVLPMLLLGLVHRWAFAPAAED